MGDPNLNGPLTTNSTWNVSSPKHETAALTEQPADIQDGFLSRRTPDGFFVFEGDTRTAMIRWRVLCLIDVAQPIEQPSYVYVRLKTGQDVRVSDERTQDLGGLLDLLAEWRARTTR